MLNAKAGTLDADRVRSIEVPDVLVGYVPLELLDFTVDSVRQQLASNPTIGGQQVLDLF